MMQHHKMILSHMERSAIEHQRLSARAYELTQSFFYNRTPNAAISAQYMQAREHELARIRLDTLLYNPLYSKVQS